MVVSKETAWNLGISGRYRLNENHTFFAGLSWYQPSINKSEQTDNYNTNQLTAILSQKNPSGLLTYYENALITQLTPESKRDLVGLYLQHKYQINQQVALTWGGHATTITQIRGQLSIHERLWCIRLPTRQNLNGCMVKPFAPRGSSNQCCWCW